MNSGRVLDGSDEAHRAGAPRADQDGPAPCSSQQRSPVEAALAIGIVGADERITRR